MKNINSKHFANLYYVLSSLYLFNINVIFQQSCKVDAIVILI